MSKKKQKQSQVIEIPQPILYTAKFLQAISSSLTTKFAAKLFTTPIRHKLPKRELHMERESVQKSIMVPTINKEIVVYEYGKSDKKVLLVHGWSGRGTQLVKIADELLKMGYMTISFDAPAHGKSKGNYLFVEQAIFDKQDKPYRVRIYKVSQRGNEFISEIYTLKDEKAWIGKWATPEVYDQLTEADIELKSGCEVVLKRTGKHRFEGATGDKTCPSELRGASWANSKVTVTENTIHSWDQGFDKDGKQVWGATKGGYEFIKI